MTDTKKFTVTVDRGSDRDPDARLIESFATKAERAAYVRGLEDAVGWMDLDWSTAEVDRELTAC